MRKKHGFKFTPAAEDVYNKVYQQAVGKQVKIKHPDTPVIDRKYWETVCHNFAVMAASAAEGRTLEFKEQKKVD